MGWFGFGRSPQTAELKDIAARYRRLRAMRFRLNNELVGRLSQDVIEEGARRIGILHRGTIVFDSEDETSVLMDYCLYDVRKRGSNAVEEYLRDCPPDPDSEEMALLRVMERAVFAVVSVLRVEPGVGCHVRNLFTGQTRLLADLAFSKTARPGLVLATRLFDFGDFITTSGAALPCGLLDEDELDAWQRKFNTAREDTSADPAPLIRECLRRGCLSHIRYEGEGEGLDGKVRFDPPERPTPALTSPAERQARASRRASKPAENRRCGCGSGKMYKNCCGKR